MMKKILIPISILLVVGLVFGAFFLLKNPTRQLKKNLTGFETHQIESILEHMDPSMSEKKQTALDELIQDLLSATTITTQIVSDEAWRVEGEKITPTPRYIASHYRATVLFTLNEAYSMEVVFHFQRQDAVDEYHFTAFIFKPWKLTNIKVLN